MSTAFIKYTFNNNKLNNVCVCVCDRKRKKRVGKLA